MGTAALLTDETVQTAPKLHLIGCQGHMRLLCVIVATLCLCLLPAQRSDSTADSILAALDLERPVSVTAYEIEDLDGDGTIEIVAITAERTVADRHIGGEIVVLRESRGELRPLWRRGGLNPWKLQIGDVDGDGPREIVCGVWKRSPFDPVMANRAFVYSWDGDEARPKWLGSRLSRRFDDFVLCDVNSDGWDELIALEIGDAEKHRVAVYRWDIFGFEWLGCSDEAAGIRGLSVEDGILCAVTASSQLRIYLLNDRVEIEPVE